MRIAVVTLAAGEEFHQMARWTHPEKQAYCRRFGYDFYYFDRVEDAERPAPWAKIPAILHVLPRYDWVFWLDVDTVLWNPDLGLRRFLARCEKPFVFQEDVVGINTGVFFVRNTPEAHHVLMRAYDQRQYTHHPLWEQRAFWEIFRDPGYRALVQSYPRGALRPSFHGFPFEGTWDALVLHLAGYRGAARLQRMERLVRLTSLPLALRLQRSDALGDLLNRCNLLAEGVVVGADGEFAPVIRERWEGRQLHVVEQHLPWRGTASPAAEFAAASLAFVHFDVDPGDAATELAAWYGKVCPGGLISGRVEHRETGAGSWALGQAISSCERRYGVTIAVTDEPRQAIWYFFKPRVAPSPAA